MRRLAVGTILALALITCACVPLYDAVTVMNLKAMSSPQAAAASCEKALAYERTKTGPAYDAKSVRHLEELCDCYARAANATQAAACKANVQAYVVYEENKR